MSCMVDIIRNDENKEYFEKVMEDKNKFFSSQDLKLMCSNDSITNLLTATFLGFWNDIQILEMAYKDNIPVVIAEPSNNSCTFSFLTPQYCSNFFCIVVKPSHNHYDYLFLPPTDKLYKLDALKTKCIWKKKKLHHAISLFAFECSSMNF